MSDQTNVITVHACGCCGDIFRAEGAPVVDKDLGRVVCPECRRNLLWAHALLKDQHITPCLPLSQLPESRIPRK